jgi:hypothetical protein
MKTTNVFLHLFFILIAIAGFAQTGIGTIAPVNKLQVEAATADPATSGASANGHFRLSGTTGSHVLDFGLSSSSTYSWLQSRSKSAYGTFYSLLLNPNGGNVGIGTISPTAKLNIAGGGIRIATGFGNATTRPALNTGSVGSYEIRGVGAGGGGTAQSDASDDGFLRLSAGGGTNTNTQASIDLSGYSTVADMSSTIVMRTLGTERLRIDPYGKVGVGTSSPATSLHIENGNTFGNPGSTSSPSIYLYNTNNASSTANSTVSVRTAGTGSGKPFYSLDVNGAFGYSMGINNPTDQMVLNTSWDFNTTATNNAIIINRTGQSRVIIPASAGTYVTDWPSGWGGGLATFDFSCAGIYYNTLAARSDKRLKNTISTITDDLIAKYLQLRPVSYYWNQDRSRDTKLQYGLIAQEVETLFPEMVNTGTDEMQTKSVNYQALHALSLKVIQSQQAEIEALKKQQADMEARLLQLEAKLK